MRIKRNQDVLDHEQRIRNRDALEVKVMNLIAKGSSERMAADAVQTSQSDVRKIKAKYSKVFKELGHIEDYRALKSDILTSLELQVSKKLSEEGKLSDAGAKDLAYILQVLDKTNRLEQGKATSIQATYSRVVMDDIANSRNVIDVTSN